VLQVSHPSVSSMRRWALTDCIRGRPESVVMRVTRLS